MRTRHLAALALLVAFSLVTGAAAAPPKDAMVVGLLAEPVTMDPPQITDLNSARITKRIFEGLVAQELGSYKLVPGPGPVVGHQQGRAHLHVQAAAQREVPRRHRVQRRGREVLLRAPAERQEPLLRDRHLPVREELPRQHRGRRSGRPDHAADQAQGPARAVLAVPRPSVAVRLQPRGAEEVGQGHGQAPGRHRTVQARRLGARREGGAGTQRCLLGRRAEGPPGHLRADHRGPGAAGRHQDRRDRPDDGRAARQPGRSPQGSQRRGGREQLLGGVVHRAEHAPSDPQGQARAPGHELRGEQGRDHPRHPQGHGHRLARSALPGLRPVSRGERAEVSL